MIPRNITKQHILKAIEQIDREGIPKKRESTKFHLTFNGKHYPPKLVLSIANQLASGRELSPEMFGGGDEANSFLQRRGFKIIDPHFEELKPACTGNTIRIGRAILDIGASMSDMKRGRNLWEVHKKILASLYLGSQNSYEQRLCNLISETEKNSLDILILPACTLVHRTTSDLDIYRNRAKSLRWLVSGVLRVNSTKQVKSFVESAEVWQNSTSILSTKADFVRFLQMDTISAYVAISSTMLNVRSQTSIREVSEFAPNQASKVFAFDLGHHQYTGRYTMSLNSVLRTIKSLTNKESLVLLAFWKYRNGSIRYPWSFPNKARWFAFERMTIPIPERSESDFLDIFTINL
ncbi:MAG: hypothetical protein QME44_08695 [Thermodesulfobacteriota bacterium]|nr:hypothetical protein [Thermodesulfobacteriota bacterium]